MRDYPKTKINNSPIHGKGVFAQQMISKDQFIGVILDLTTGNPNVTSHLGIFVNHSQIANAFVLQEGLRFFLIASQNIPHGTEVLSNYNLLPEMFARAKNYYK